ncbi:hypothetical protein QN416_25130, partial [Glaciimonas sp. Cout2]|uniref:hypothetical protein n=1 Tax=Glaciimonas sp. Cout2 TaxID=3048621 RepID=UPI002B22D78F
VALYVERGGKTVLAFDGSQVGGADDVDAGAVPAGNRADADDAVGAPIGADVAAARDALFAAAAGALAATVTSGRIAKLGVETVNGAFVI